MKIECIKNNNISFFIEIEYCKCTINEDSTIMRLLDLSYTEYTNIAKLNNCFFRGYGIYFEMEEDCKKCIEDIKQKCNTRLVYLKLIENTKEAEKIIIGNRNMFFKE